MNHLLIQDPFWSKYQELIRTVSIPYQYEALNDRVQDAEPSHCLANFRIAAGLQEGSFHGFPFQDSDAAKWLEAVAGTLTWHPDPELERRADEVIDLICAAQQPDGYLDTFYILNNPEKRWTNLKDHHELYVAGHLIEAAVAYYEATGKSKLLDACLRLVDLIDRTLGPEPEKLPGYPGHPEIELALMKLYALTGEEKPLRLASFFINQRGQHPLYFEEENRNHGNFDYWKDHLLGWRYYQADRPVREQTEAEGHAVRALYLYSGMADVARVTGDASLQKACDTLWRNVVRRQMYITGAVGSSECGESFTFDYDLPNDTVYGETCAAIALFLLAWRLLKGKIHREYADIMERTLYNSILSGMQLDGKKFFYVNPLEVLPEACRLDEHKRHVKPVRQKWFGCACCPPNIARLLAHLGEYCCSVLDNTAFVHLFIAGEAALELKEGKLQLRVSADYPRNPAVGMTLHPAFSGAYRFGFRIPGYCSAYRILVNGVRQDPALENGYAVLSLEGDCEIRFEPELPVRVMWASPLVRADAGRVCLMRGPVVYCLEEADNGKNLQTLFLPKDVNFTLLDPPGLPGVLPAIRGSVLRLDPEAWDPEELYSDREPSYSPAEARWIPYYAWANRGEGEMTVWMHAL